MTAIDDYSPWREVAQLDDVLVIFDELPSGRAWWIPTERVLFIDSRLTRAEARCALAHELEHINRGDVSVADVSSVLDVRQEIATSVAAARRLIPLDRLVTVLLWSQDEYEIADELHVDVETIRLRLLTLTVDEHAVIDRRLLQDEGRIA